MISTKTVISVIMPVYVGEQWHVLMTRFAIDMLRECTKLPFELVIAEVGGDHFKSMADTHIRTEGLGYIQRDINRAIEASSGEYVVVTGNDVIVKPNWLDALIRPFEVFGDCGLTSLSAREGDGGLIGPSYPVDLIVETVYCPLMLFHRKWRLDETYPGMYGDSDLVMRIYAAGLRAYMNCSSPIYHFHGVASANALNAENTSHQKEVGLALFRERWATSPYLLARLILNGTVRWGREYQI